MISKILSLSLSALLAVPFLTSKALAAPVDTDGDGMPNRWEVRYNLNPFIRNARKDQDSDGLRNLEEYKRRSNPINPDTDGDTLSDGAEVKVFKTNPLRVDTDRDGISDDLEDSNNDGRINGEEDPS